MSLRDLIHHELQQLSSFQTGPYTLSVSESEQQLTCELVAFDSLACAFETVVLQTPVLAQATIEYLQTLSQNLSRRLGYLLETIGVLEADAEQCVVQMRSIPPQQGDDGASYYELLVRRGGELRLSRYCKSAGSERKLIPAYVTHEVLLRLVTDFCTVLNTR